MSLKEDVELMYDHIIDINDYPPKYPELLAAFSRIKTVLEPLMRNDTDKPVVVDYTPVYRCKCGEKWQSKEMRDQYCPKCNEKMELVK
jgi:hypothetical protein